MNPAATRDLLAAIDRNGQHKKLDAVKAAIGAGADVNAATSAEASVLIRACTSGLAAEGVVLALLDAGARVDSTDRDGRTALHFTAFGDGDVELAAAKLLLDRGALVNARDTAGSTPLHCAAFNDNERMAKLFIERGADINAKNNDGKTPLQQAAVDHAKKVMVVLRKAGRSA